MPIAMRHAAAVLAFSAGSAFAQDILFFESYDFNGRRYGVSYSVSNMNDVGFNDRAESVVIRNGTWQLCADAYFRGRCVTLEPGEYRNLGQMGLANQVSSARQLGGGNWGGGSRGAVTLFEDYNFGGRSYAVQGPAENLGRTGFNDRAASMRVERGYWMFCSDSEFRGTCRTFGPGDYPSLGGGLDRQISSGRRIHNDYPYRNNPNWGEYTQQ